MNTSRFATAGSSSCHLEPETDFNSTVITLMWLFHGLGSASGVIKFPLTIGRGMEEFKKKCLRNQYYTNSVVFSESVTCSTSFFSGLFSVELACDVFDSHAFPIILPLGLHILYSLMDYMGQIASPLPC